jgi:hypothetical protein
MESSSLPSSMSHDRRAVSAFVRSHAKRVSTSLGSVAR